MVTERYQAFLAKKVINIPGTVGKGKGTSSFEIKGGDGEGEFFATAGQANSHSGQEEW